MTDRPRPKPAHLGPQYASQFRDSSVAGAYAARPPYPDEVFDILKTLMPGQPRRVLELGCGTGDLTLALARHVDWLDAVDFSESMLAVAFSRPGADHPNLQWHEMPAESFEPANQYNLIVAGACLHWMDWPVLFPRLATFLKQDGMLVIINRHVVERPWEHAVLELIPTYSTNQEFEAYNLVNELASRGFFTEYGHQDTTPVPFSQSLDAYVESFHSSNGFSRQRMDRDSAKAFDDAVREIATPWCPEGIVRGDVVGTVIWGKPHP